MEKKTIGLLLATVLTILVLLVVSGFIHSGDRTGGNETQTPETEISTSVPSAINGSLRKAGNIVTFGRYPQTAEGTDETPIEWIVLDYDAVNHRALLISKYGLDVKPYNNKPASVTWETCSLRAWLNNDFLSKAFSREEQDAILLTDVDNGDAQGYTGGASGGNNTQDRIFLLSYTEAKRYFNIEHYSVSRSEQNSAARVAPTAYAIRQGAWTSISSKTADGSAVGWWWLRSPGNYQDNAAGVSSDGSRYNYYVNYGGGCVRLALWINLESDYFNK